ncbi:hypothetical protein WJX72_007604 [[Myrmecia] bisecta]|uniref:Uncharacterized protein n=1 Tax=[Myrmecia] bisecta TaxID=41462 RepID=A0AAW1R7K9_9CHLO
MSSAVAAALTVLAKGCAARGDILQAIQCYEAVLQSTTELPQVEAEARLAAATLLLEHTHNLTEAQRHLERAQILLHPLPAFHSLKCEVFSALGRVYKCMAQQKLEKQTYQRALELCKNTQRSDERHVLQRWQPHFLMRLAQTYIVAEDFLAAHEILDQAYQAAREWAGHDIQAMVQLAKMQLHLSEWNQQGAAEAQARAAAAIKALQATEQQQGRGQALLTAQLRLHAEVLRVLLVMVCGETGNQEWIETTCQTLEALLAQTRHQPWSYEWMPAAAVTALVCLLLATVQQPSGKLKQGLMYIARGREVVEEAIQKHHLAEVEHQLATFSVWEHQVFLVLKLLLMEASSAMYLTQCELARAQAEISAMVDMFSRYPQLLSALQGGLHKQIGHYAMAVCDFTAAQRHFTAALALATGEQAKQMAAIHIAAAWLSGPDEAEGSRQAIDVLSQHGLYSDIAESVTMKERAGGLLLSGLVLMRRNDDLGNTRLTKALKFAHANLGNHQLVAQVLNLLTPLQLQKGDLSGAENMLASGFTLSKSLFDLPSQITTLRLVQDICVRKGDTDKQAGNAAYLQRKSSLQWQPIGDREQRFQAATGHAEQLAALLAALMSIYIFPPKDDA